MRALIVAAMGLLWSLQSIAVDLPKGAQAVGGAGIVQPRSSPGALIDTVIFTQGKDGISGVWNSQGQQTGYKISGVKVHEGSVSFKVSYGTFGDGVWRGKISTQDELRITFVGEDATTPATILRRASPAELAEAEAKTKNLITHKIQLPVLRDLPSNGLSLTPPMGWNSWNKFALTIDDQAVRGIADALVSSGLRDAGYIYVNIDDGWQGSRDQEGVLHPNSKFPDMKALADYVHSKGLKLGIYNSPGPVSCGGYVGTHGYETQDAATFARWGIDYLKYDWCSARSIYHTQQEMQALYQKMGAALQATGHPIVYSLCQYGLFDVGSWGRKVGGNLWRSSGDVADNWQSMSSNGFKNHGNSDYAGPGGWNDPDMLEIGNGGMTVQEYRTHMTLWSMLAAPLILGNDIRHMTSDVREILLNKEVIAIDQDPLGRQGRRVIRKGSSEVWTKPLADGSTVVALFNRGEKDAKISVVWSHIGLKGAQKMRDLWQHADLGERPHDYGALVPAHGVILLRATEVQ
jgi:alpha-galactosidase